MAGSIRVGANLMLLVGFIWAAFAPLLLVIPILALGYLLRRRDWARPMLVAAGLVATLVAALYAMDRAAFSAVCREVGRPMVIERAIADGVYLNSGTANSFGTRYIHDEGFMWIERNDIYARGSFVRVAKDGSGRLSETKIPELTARYEVAESHEVRPDGTGVSWVQVLDRQAGKVLARAGDANFQGGRMKWVLGAYGSASCMSAMRDPEGFRAYYHLARDTLRPN